jgi:hypothetical protein
MAREPLRKRAVHSEYGYPGNPQNSNEKLYREWLKNKITYRDTKVDTTGVRDLRPRVEPVVKKSGFAKNAIGQSRSEVAQIKRGGNKTLPVQSLPQKPNRQKSAPNRINALRRMMDKNRRKSMKY